MWTRPARLATRGGIALSSDRDQALNLTAFFASGYPIPKSESMTFFIHALKSFHVSFF